MNVTLEYGQPSNAQSPFSPIRWLFLIMAIVTGSRADVEELICVPNVQSLRIYIAPEICARVPHGDSRCASASHPKRKIHIHTWPSLSAPTMNAIVSYRFNFVDFQSDHPPEL